MSPAFFLPMALSQRHSGLTPSAFRRAAASGDSAGAGRRVETDFWGDGGGDFAGEHAGGAGSGDAGGVHLATGGTGIGVAPRVGTERLTHDE